MKLRVSLTVLGLLSSVALPVWAQQASESASPEAVEPGAEAATDEERASDAAEGTPPPGSPAVDDATRAAARDLATRGSELYRAGEYAQALDRFDRAYQLVEVPSLAIWAARACVKLGRLVEASERYLRVAKAPVPSDAPDSHRRAVEDAALERSTLMPRIPTLRLVLDGAPSDDVNVSIDGRPIQSALVGVEQLMDPGQHRVVARRGDQVVEETVDLSEGQHQDVVLAFEQSSSGATDPLGATADTGPRSSNNTLAYVALGVGGAALAVGGVTGVMLLSRESDVLEQCPDRTCPAGVDDGQSFNSLRTVSTLGFVAGAVFAGAGVYLLLSGSDDGSPEQPEVGLWLTPSGGGVRGAF